MKIAYLFLKWLFVDSELKLGVVAIVDERDTGTDGLDSSVAAGVTL